MGNLLEYANTKAAVLQVQLAKTPEITEQAFNAARESAERLSSGNFYQGLFSAAVAGLTGGLAIYTACENTRRKKE